MTAPAPTDPYRIEGPATVNFSGGRSSGYLLRRILDAYGGTLPEDIVPVFANTGKERPETLDFVAACEREWGVRIRWLEFRFDRLAKGGVADPKNTFREVDYETAARNGEPFEELLSVYFLPTPIRRICTENLKVKTVERFARKVLGWREWRTVLGIRYDEKRRWGRLLYQDCAAEMPLVAARATRETVADFWRSSPFDLGMDSRLSNCDLCYLRSRTAIVDMLREEPGLADWWIRAEEESGRRFDRPEAYARFNLGYSYRDLLAESRQPTLFDREAPGDMMDCYCTD